jgi:hypothetical protein
VSRKPDEPAAGESKEAFASRWSRLKQEARQAPPAAELPVDPEAPAPELPPLDKLTIDSDFRAFFHPKVGEDVRRAALKKLFGDPRFNVMDGLDVYIDDYSKTEPIPPEMLAGLRQAQAIIASAKADTEDRERAQRAKEQQSLKDEATPGIEPPAEPFTPVSAAGRDAADAVPVPPEGALKPQGGNGAA